MPAGDGVMTDMPPLVGPAAGAAVQGLIDRHDLVAMRDRVAGSTIHILPAEYLRLPSHWPQRAGEYRSAISERSKSGRAYRPSGGGPAWQSRGRAWRRVWAPS